MAICKKCGGSGKFRYECEYDLNAAFGVQWLKQRQVLDGMNASEIEDLCPVCWGTGDNDRAGVHPKAKGVHIDGDQFIKHPSTLPDGETMWRLPLGKKPDGHWLKYLKQQKCYWANFTGRQGREIDIEKEDIPSWATHLYIRNINPNAGRRDSAAESDT